MRPSKHSAMPARGAGFATVRKSGSAIVVAIGSSLWLCSTALAAPPAPCNGVVQISDKSGDGHHENEDLLSAWFSEQAGRLQAVIKVNVGDWRPMHVDSPAAGFALLFDVGGQWRFVRVEAPNAGPIRYDHGTWTLAGGFVSTGPTTGEVTTGSGGTATIDVPAETGAVPGARLVRPFVLTYDGTTSTGERHWVDRAPGEASPGEAAFGADFVVGTCQPGPPAGPGAGDNPAGGTGGAGTGEDPAALATTAVVLDARKRLVGAGRVRASGRVIPARAGVTVRVTAKPRRPSKASWVRSVQTLADGSFEISIPLSESTTVTADAEGINAQTRTITVQSTVRMTLRRLASGKTVAGGRVSPRLPGRVLLLRTNAAVPSATTIVRRGRFHFSPRRLARGRYQAVFIPSGNRAERSTSASGVVR